MHFRVGDSGTLEQPGSTALLCSVDVVFEGLNSILEITCLYGLHHRVGHFEGGLLELVSIVSNDLGYFSIPFTGPPFLFFKSLFSFLSKNTQL